MESKNVWGMIFLTIIILSFVVGGYFAMDYFTQVKEDVKTDKPKEETVDLRIDKTKDYIYYENGEEILEEEEITRDEAVLNFTTLKDINDNLRKEEKEIYQDIKYIKDLELEEDLVYQDNEEGIYSLKYRNYENYKFNDYVSLISVDYDYDVVNGSVPYALKSYVVDINTGNILSEEELLNKYNLSKSIIEEKIKDRLNDTQVLSEEENVIDINGTIDNLKYTLYINKLGKLTVSFIVKSNKINYNDVVVLN